MPWAKIFLDSADVDATLTRKGLRSLTYSQALREAHEQLLQSDRAVYIMGEGVDDPGGVFGSTISLAKRYGKNRVMDIPIAENGLTGIAIGSALAGMKPIFVHMRMDFLPLSMDQIINHAAKWRFMSGGAVRVPIVIRSIIGRGWGSAAQHAQALHSLFLSIPGLKIVMPSTPYDVKGLLIASVNDGNPIIFIEHRWLYNAIGYVPEDMYSVPFGNAVIRQKGNDATVVAVSLMVYEAIKAALALSQEGISIEVIDLRTLRPLDMQCIYNSVKKTRRLVIADVGCLNGGIAAEITARLSEKESGSLAAPLERIGLPDMPIPASFVLEKCYYPGKEDIIKAVKKTLCKEF